MTGAATAAIVARREPLAWSPFRVFRLFRGLIPIPFPPPIRAIRPWSKNSGLPFSRLFFRGHPTVHPRLHMVVSQIVKPLAVRLRQTPSNQKQPFVRHSPTQEPPVFFKRGSHSPHWPYESYNSHFPGVIKLKVGEMSERGYVGDQP
jgi:hypothetical protein